MSLLLFLFYWVGVPVLFFMSARLLFRRAGTPFGKGLVIVVTASSLLWLFWLAAGERWWLDYRVRKLCAEDGGVKVYETVELPPELIGKRGQMQIPEKSQVKPSDKYYYELIKHYYRKGNPEMSRRQYRIIRRSDGKVLGELVLYGRGGGDLPGPWHESSFTCPEPSKLPNFESLIFTDGDKR